VSRQLVSWPARAPLDRVVVVIFARSVALLGGAVTALTRPVLGVVISVVGFVVLAAGAGCCSRVGVEAGWRPAATRT
jgi:hypothetical protein